MPALAEDWGEVYNKSTLAFAGPKKLGGNIKFWTDFFKPVIEGTSALAKSLGVLDQNDPERPEFRTAEERKEHYKVYVEELKALKKAADKYATVLDKAIRETDKATWPDAYRELKVLRKQLEVVVAKAENWAATHSKEYAKADVKAYEKIRAVEDELRQQNLSDEEIKVELDYLKQQKLLLAFPTAAKSGLTKAAVLVQKIKADPTPATYNSEMGSARDMTQNMSNLVKLVSDDKCPRRLKQELAGLADHRAALAKFGSSEPGNARQVPDDADRAAILELVKEFSQLTKAMMPYYEKTVKYLAKHKLK
jgi:hypothetical protein